MTGRRASLLIGLLTCLTVGPRAVANDGPVPKIAGVRVGFDGCYKVGAWTPIAVSVTGDGSTAGQVRVTVPDAEGISCRYATDPQQPCDLRRDTTVRLCVRFGRAEGPLEIELLDGGQTVDRRRLETAAQADAEHFRSGLEMQKLIVVIGADATVVQDAVQLPGLEAGRRPVVARIDDLDLLPRQWFAYEGVDAVVIGPGQSKLFGGCTAQSPSVAALADWLHSGGRIALAVGPADKALIAADGPLRDFAPGQLQRVRDLPQTSGLELYCRSSTPLAAGAGVPTKLPIVQLAGVTGKVELREFDLPLVVRTAHGLGQVVFFAADWSQPPLAAWRDRPALVARLLDLPIAPTEDEIESDVTHFGFSDLAGQLRSALDRFDGVASVPFAAVGGLLLIYLVLIGPADYFFLRRVARRMTWTWLSSSVIILGFCVLAVGLARWLKGAEVRVHQVELVDVDVASQRAWGNLWFHVFSPRADSYQVSLRPGNGTVAADGHAEVLLGWFAVPGEMLGGARLGGQGFEPAAWNAAYESAPQLDALDGVPMQFASTRSFAGRWVAPAPPGLDCDLTLEGQLPVGTVTSRLDVPLTQCILAFDRWAFELGTLAPGQTVQLSPLSRVSELKTYLTGQKIVLQQKGEKFHQEATPYDQTSLDPAYVLRMMGFYQAAGGRRYVGLANECQGRVDFSRLLATGRAILVGQVEPDAAAASASQVLRDGQPLPAQQTQRTFIYRFVIPVHGT